MQNCDITLRSIQQYLYCPHRWGLIETDCSFAENAFVYKGKQVHEAVDTKRGTCSRGVIHENAVQVYHDGWGIRGIVDCLELRASQDGVPVVGRQGKFQITIVEYKVSAPKQGEVRNEDAMQVLGQKICVDALFDTDYDAFFYYADTKKRVKVTFCQSGYDFLEKTLVQMRKLRAAGVIPPMRDNQHCGGCSLKDICLPKKKVKKV